MVSLRAPEFWWRKAGAAAALLYPASAIYGAIAAQRMLRDSYRAKIPVLCIGNPTLGGAGKTPAAIAITKRLLADGKRVFLLTRGYGGSEAGPLLVDPSRHNAQAVGDEALLLAAVAPTIVARDRALGAKLAETSGAEIIVMDDGFQNPSLAKDFSLLVVDGARGVGNGLVFPAGPLRAPLSPQLSHAQAMLVIGEGSAGVKAAALAAAQGLRVFKGSITIEKESAAALANQKVLAFAGIGAPEKFFRSLEEAGAIVAAWKTFGDHHRYTDADAEALLSQAKEAGLLLVTTEKDLARMQGDPALAELASHAKTLKIGISLDDEREFFASITQALAR